MQSRPQVVIVGISGLASAAHAHAAALGHRIARRQGTDPSMPCPVSPWTLSDRLYPRCAARRMVLQTLK